MAALPDFDLCGRVAIVTGGNGGIGAAIALALARSGAAVAVLARNEAKNLALLSELQATGARCLAHALDVCDRGALEPAFDRVEQQLGPVDILVNNAGIAVLAGSLDHTMAQWDAVIETNLSATFQLSRIAARSMMRRGGGKIINIASEYSRFGAGMLPSYSAAKGGLELLTRSMAVEFAPHNIQVNALAPGWISTDMTAVVKSSPMEDEILLRTPAGRWGRPEECAGTAVFLASRAADFVTGATVFVDGGYSIR